MADAGRRAELTYRDVVTVLALLEGSVGRHVHFDDGELEVRAIQAAASAASGGGESASSETMLITSPAVGFFHALDDLQMGAYLESDSELATVEAPGAVTAVTIEAGGTVSAWLVDPGAFVEFGQPLAELKRVVADDA